MKRGIVLFSIFLIFFSSCTLLNREKSNEQTLSGSAILTAVCPSTNEKYDCLGGWSTSSTGLHTRCYLNPEKTSYKTCSIGWVEYVAPVPIEQPVILDNTGNMRCYPEKQYCRKYGLLTNPAIPISEVVT